MKSEIDFQIAKIQDAVKEYLDNGGQHNRKGLVTAVLAHNGTYFIITVNEEEVSDDW